MGMIVLGYFFVNEVVNAVKQGRSWANPIGSFGFMESRGIYGLRSALDITSPRVRRQGDLRRIETHLPLNPSGITHRQSRP
jgi:hypothetical protein